MSAIPAGASNAEGLKLWMTDPNMSENKIEFLYFEKGTCFPELIQTTAHIAYSVPCLKSALTDKKVLFAPLDCGSQTIAFIEEEGIPIELIEFK
ncbi:MAG: hypothetical protein RR034_08745 [Bacteroidales bacterium]